MVFRNLKKKLENWEKESSRKDKILLLIVTIIMPPFLFFKFYYEPNQNKINQLKEEIKRLELEISKLEDSVRREKEIEIQLKEREKFLDEVKLILPAEEEIPGLLKEVSRIAKRNRLEIIVFTPKDEIKHDYYDIIPFDVNLKGNFREIINFLNDVEKLPRLITFHKIELSPIDKEEKILMKCNLITYKYTGKPLERQDKK